MTGQRSIVDDWRSRLDEYERELGEPAKPRNWVVRAYAKVLRFLLSFYSGQETTAPPEDAGKMESWVAEPIGPGKPARSAEAVRQTVSAIHDANAPNVESGPLVAGLRPDDLILLDSFRNWPDLDRCLTVLEKHEIKWQLEYDSEWTRVKVLFKDHTNARAILDKRRPKRRPRKRRLNPHELEYSTEKEAVEAGTRYIGRLVIGMLGFPVGGTIGQVIATCIAATKPMSENMILYGAILGVVVTFWLAGRWLPWFGK